VSQTSWDAQRASKGFMSLVMPPDAEAFVSYATYASSRKGSGELYPPRWYTCDVSPGPTKNNCGGEHTGQGPGAILFDEMEIQELGHLASGQTRGIEFVCTNGHNQNARACRA
jgi:hypothetical protein